MAWPPRLERRVNLPPRWRSRSTATRRTIDAGMIGGHPFFNIAGIGFDARVRRYSTRAAPDAEADGPMS